MKSNYDVLRPHIRPVDVRNKELAVDLLLGVSISKQFIPSIANTVGTDLSAYKVVRGSQFAYGPVTSRNGDKVSIALLNSAVECIISSSYSVFEVIDADKLLPEYLMLWFKRPEFDRYTRFKSHGSVREIFDWDEMCKVALPVPDIEVQRSIVRAYNTIEGRIKHLRQINDNLEATAQALFDELFFHGPVSEEVACQLEELAFINPNRTLAKGAVARCFEMASLPTKGCVPIGNEVKAYNGGMRFKNGDTIMARITPCLENGKAAYINILNEGEVAFGSTEYIVIAAKPLVPMSFFYFLVRNSSFITFAISQMNGSSGRQRVSGTDIAAFVLNRPNHNDLQKFDALGSQILEQIKANSLEMMAIERLQTVLLSNLSNPSKLSFT